MSNRKIIVAYDGSPNSKKALKFGGEIAKEIGAEVSLVSVVDNDFRVFNAEVVVPEFERMQQALEDFGRKALEGGAALAREMGLEVKTVLLTGHPAEALINYGDKEKVYLIVVGSRGLGGFQSLMLGSVTQHILSHSTIPVLVAR